MKILITGGAGFIGSNLAHSLAKEGNELYIIDNLSEGSVENLHGIDYKLHKCDITKLNLFFYDFSSFLKDMDLIYHLVASKMTYSIDNPQKDLRVNAGGILNLLEYARRVDVPLIYTSTGSIYGKANKFPVKESHPSHPESPYGVSKYAAEQYCRLYNRLYGLRTIILRIHSVYGPRQKPIGVIPKFIRQALNGESMTIEGTGEQERPFTYVDDCVRGIRTVASKGEIGETYNIATDKICNINDMSRIISEELNISWKYVFVKRKKGGLDKANPSIEKIKELGWEPKIDLREGIRQTIDWIKNRG